MIKWIAGFFSANSDVSSKRLLSILSVLSAISITWYSLIYEKTIDANELALILGLCGLSVGQQVLGNKNEVKKDAE